MVAGGQTLGETAVASGWILRADSRTTVGPLVFSLVSTVSPLALESVLNNKRRNTSQIIHRSSFERWSDDGDKRSGPWGAEESRVCFEDESRRENCGC